MAKNEGERETYRIDCLGYDAFGLMTSCLTKYLGAIRPGDGGIA
jgi:hypothetical protein